MYSIQAQRPRVTPGDYGLPHEYFQENQVENIQWCYKIEEIGALEAPTGSGKTLLPAAMAMDYRVGAVVKSKFLQAENYDRGYGFHAHYGRSNYKCAHPYADSGNMADDCIYEMDMHACPCEENCEYLISKAEACEARKFVVNVAYWLTAKNFREKYYPEVLFIDECHNLSKIVTDWVGSTITNAQRIAYELIPFPNIDSTKASNDIFGKRGSDPRDMAINWLVDCAARMKDVTNEIRLKMDWGNEWKAKYKRACELASKIGGTMEALQNTPSGWYIKSGASINRAPCFTCKPLTAKFHFRNYFTGNYKTIMMSATIGDIEAFSAELGLSDIAFRAVPHRYPVEKRPILALDCPSMGRTATEGNFNEQARVIAKLIKSLDPSWPGLILVTRKSEANKLAGRLSKHGLGDRIFVPPGADSGSYAPTDVQLAAWQNEIKRKCNPICISWTFWEGLDGRDEGFVIAAKTPYPYLGDDFTMARMKYNPKVIYLETGNLLSQGLGRSRRTDLDYERGTVAAIADGGWKRVQKYIASYVKEAIVEMKL